jgi:hypothetical protein
MNDETARRRAFALALVALEGLPEGKRPTELIDRFGELLARPGIQGLHPSMMLAEAKRLLRPDLDPNPTGCDRGAGAVD